MQKTVKNRVKNIYGELAVFVSLVLLAFCAAAPAEEPAVPAGDGLQALSAVITEISGKHVQFSADDGKTFAAAQTGTKLGRNDLVRTGFASRCQVSFGGHTLLQIEPLSSVRISEYLGNPKKEIVHARGQYGAVRCGVEKGRIQTDTKISTPVSTMSIRGTVIYVEYDAGTRRCLLGVDEDGPAIARTFARPGCTDCDASEPRQERGREDPNRPDGRLYVLDEGMKTDCSLSRYLELAIFERHVWVTGNYVFGDITDAEAASIVYIGGFYEPTDGALEYTDERYIYSQKISESEIDFPGGDIPIGDVPAPHSDNPAHEMPQ